jgi:hypothetical protein
MRRTAMVLLSLLAFVSLPLWAQGRSYSEGPVMQVAAIKIKAGHFDEYMKYLATTWKKEQQALKDAGVTLDYGVWQATSVGAGDPDVYLTTTYANMAALDGLEDRSDPVIAKALGTNRDQDMKGMADRNAYREVVSVEYIRELKLK